MIVGAIFMAKSLRKRGHVQSAIRKETTMSQKSLRRLIRMSINVADQIPVGAFDVLYALLVLGIVFLCVL